MFDFKSLKFNKGKAAQKSPSFGYKVGNVWENPKVLEVNLIKESTRASLNWGRNFFRLFVSFLIALLFITEIYWGLTWWGGQEDDRSNKLIDDLKKVSQETRLVKAQGEEFLIFKDKVSSLQALLNGHVYFSNLFSWFERYTLSSVFFDGFTGDTKGAYSFSATAQNYSDVSYQVKTFKDASETMAVEVPNVNALQSKDKDGRILSGIVAFPLSIKINPQIFKK